MNGNDIPLITTKLNRPRPSEDLIPRPGLIERLESGRFRKLTLVCAPAGYGKTALAGVWADACRCPVAWVSLDSNDNDIRTFLLYLTAAIRTVFPKACAETQALLNGSQLPSPPYLAAKLVNETAALPDHFLLILDDYHAITDPAVQQLVATLIQYQSANIHLVFLTRQDPLLDLSSLRAKGQVTEVRVNDLRFSETEVQQYLEAVSGKQIPAEVAHRLAERTEGWPAGLRLAFLAMRQQADESEFLEKYQGTNQYVMGYLVDEVLNQQPPAVHAFLLCTSILDRFCAPLADALLAAFENGKKGTEAGVGPPSKETLKQLQRANLFLVALDQEGAWFRYHHLFQELLLYRLKTGRTRQQLAALHRAAGEWLALHGSVQEALDHYLLAGDNSAAVNLVAGQRYRLLNETRWQQLHHYLRSFSEAIIEQNADLLMTKAWLLYHDGHWGKLSPVLDRLEALLHQPGFSAGVAEPLRGEMHAVYALLNYTVAKPKEAVGHARSALAQAPRELWIVRTLARICLAAALQMRGDLGAAYAAAQEGLTEQHERADYFKAVELLAVCNVASIAADLDRAIQAAEQSIRLSQEAANKEIQGQGRYHLGHARYERNDLSGAAAQFSLVAQQPYLNYGVVYTYSAIGLALTHLARGRVTLASQTARALVDFLMETGNLSLLPVAQAFQAELALRQGDLAAAGQWAAQFKEPPPPAPVYRLYSPHLTLAKIWLAQNSPESRRRASELLSQLQRFFTSTHNTRFLLEVLAMQALRYDSVGAADQAAAALHKALRLAQPGGLIRVFVDLGAPMADLLARLQVDDTGLRAYITQIQQAFAPTPSPPGNGRDQPLAGDLSADALTPRESDILLLLGERKTNKEIAAQLFISENTVRFHLKNLYAKLDVSNRRQAARRAQELGIILSQ